MWYLYTNYIIGKGYIQPTDILPKCNNLSWSSDSDTLATSLNFDCLYDLAEGRTHLTLMKDAKVVFQGVVISKTNKVLSSSYTAMDYAFYLNKNETLIQFNKTNAKQALEQLCNKFNIPHAITSLNTKIDKLYRGDNISQIIDDILEQCESEIGEELIKEMRGNVLWIDKISNLKLDCRYKLEKDFSVTRSMEELKNNVLVVSNAENDTRILENAKDDTSIQIFGQLTKVLTVEEKNESQARNIAQNYLNQHNRTKKEISISILPIENGEDIRAKRMIKVSIPMYGVDGYYKIKSAQHSLQNNNHKINLTIDFS